MEEMFLFEHVSDPIIIVDRDFRIVRANPGFCRFFGIAEEQARGKRSCDLFKELNFSRCNEACMRVINKEVESNKWVEVPDEHCPHFDCVNPIFNEKGALQKAMLILKTAGRPESSTNPASPAEEIGNKEDVLQTIYHDLASPIQVIRACTDVVAMELEDKLGLNKEVVRDMIEASRRNERRLYEMVRTIRMIPQLEGDDIYRREPVRPHEVVGAVCSDFRLLLRNDVRLEWEIQPNMPEVMVEPNLLTRVFFNLLDNAARYTHANGRITVSAKYQTGDTLVTFAVFDNGEPIAPNLQASLFQKNATIDAARNAVATRRDHGWGLYFCRLTVERFGGSIWVESREDWGTQFTFTLPVAST